MSGLSPTLLGMPHFILDNIVEKTDVFARCSLQKCCKHLQNFVPKSPFHFEKIKIFFALQIMTLEITVNSETLVIKYCDPSSQETRGTMMDLHPDILFNRGNPETKRHVEVRDVNYIQRLVSDLVTIVGGAKVTIGKLEFRNAKFFTPPRPEYSHIETYETRGTYPMEQFQTDKAFFINVFLEKLGDKILKVETLDFIHFPSKYEDDVLKILGTLKPGYLKDFYIGSTWGAIDKPFTRITTTEHWKQASRLNIASQIVPAKELAHFKQIKSSAFKPTLQFVDDLIQAALAHGDSFDNYRFWGCWRDDEIFRKYVEDSCYSKNRVPLEIGRLFISGGPNDLEIRRVSAEYLEEKRREHELLKKWRAENNIN